MRQAPSNSSAATTQSSSSEPVPPARGSKVLPRASPSRSPRRTRAVTPLTPNASDRRWQRSASRWRRLPRPLPLTILNLELPRSGPGTPRTCRCSDCRRCAADRGQYGALPTALATLVFSELASSSMSPHAGVTSMRHGCRGDAASAAEQRSVQSAELLVPRSSRLRPSSTERGQWLPLFGLPATAPLKSDVSLGDLEPTTSIPSPQPSKARAREHAPDDAGHEQRFRCSPVHARKCLATRSSTALDEVARHVPRWCIDRQTAGRTSSAAMAQLRGAEYLRKDMPANG